MTWIERPTPFMTAELVRALVVPGLDAGESLEHAAFGGEMPTWDGVKSGLAKLASRIVGEVKATKPADAAKAVFEIGGLIMVAEIARTMGVHNPEDIVDAATASDAPPPPKPTVQGSVLAATSKRIVLLEIHSVGVHAPPPQEGYRVFVAVKSATWWTRPVAKDASMDLTEDKWLGEPIVRMDLEDESGQRKLFFPEQPEFPESLAAAREIAAIRKEGRQSEPQ